MTVPAGTIPLTDEFVSNGVPTGTSSWVSPYNATATSGIGSTLRTHTADGTWNGTNRLNRSILIGYMTQSWYEGAVLKHDIWAGN